mmetsp:Transcript_11912/g.30566  ORF Transcript_11912/g.30566 Transcript_11912/m.30566 type:complete len:218 (+) Transcript_11912:129-782(+)
MEAKIPPDENNFTYKRCYCSRPHAAAAHALLCTCQRKYLFTFWRIGTNAQQACRHHHACGLSVSSRCSCPICSWRSCHTGCWMGCSNGWTRLVTQRCCRWNPMSWMCAGWRIPPQSRCWGSRSRSSSGCCCPWRSSTGCSPTPSPPSCTSCICCSQWLLHPGSTRCLGANRRRSPTSRGRRSRCSQGLTGAETGNGTAGRQVGCSGDGLEDSRARSR